MMYSKLQIFKAIYLL